MDKKYEILMDESKKIVSSSSGIISVYRIRAIKGFLDVKAGDKGGFVGGGKNLSQHDDCWIYDDACVTEDGLVFERGQVREDSLVLGNATVSGNAIISGKARISGKSRVNGHATITDNVSLLNSCRVGGVTKVINNTVVTGLARVFSDDLIGEENNMIIGGTSEVKDAKDIELKYRNQMVRRCTVEGNGSGSAKVIDFSGEHCYDSVVSLVMIYDGDGGFINKNTKNSTLDCIMNYMQDVKRSTIESINLGDKFKRCDYFNALLFRERMIHTKTVLAAYGDLGKDGIEAVPRTKPTECPFFHSQDIWIDFNSGVLRINRFLQSNLSSIYELWVNSDGTIGMDVGGFGCEGPSMFMDMIESKFEQCKNGSVEVYEVKIIDIDDIEKECNKIIEQIEKEN